MNRRCLGESIPPASSEHSFSPPKKYAAVCNMALAPPRTQPGAAIPDYVKSRCGALAAVAAPFPHPAHRTGRADFPHPALGQDFTPSPTASHAPATAALPAPQSARLPHRLSRGLLDVHCALRPADARSRLTRPFPSQASTAWSPPPSLRLLPAGAKVAGWVCLPLRTRIFLHGALRRTVQDGSATNAPIPGPHFNGASEGTPCSAWTAVRGPSSGSRVASGEDAVI